MKTIDALNILSITETEINFGIVKKAYRKACKTYHPDINPAGLATMQAVNEALETLSKEKFPLTFDFTQEFNNYGKALNSALNNIIHIQDILTEVCGSWVWISGNTRPHKETLKESNFLWSRNKKMWYFRPKSDKKRYYRGSSSIDEIRTKYGSDKVSSRYRKALS